MNLKEMTERRSAIYETEIDKAQGEADLDALQTELRKLDLMISEEERKAASLVDERTAAVSSAVPGVVATGARVQAQAAEQRSGEPEDKYSTTEYRKAFMQYVTRGTAIPAEIRAGDENTLTSDVATAIPTILIDRIVEKLEAVGMILNLITRTTYASGVNIPTSSVKPVATWVNEAAGSDKQKKTTSYITFSKFKLRCEISMSMEVSVMAISAFENAFVRQVSEAMVKAIETAIISTANGATSCKGILAETPASGQALTASKLDYDKLIETEAALPEEYEGNAVYCMTKKTFMYYIGMTDAEGQPIARVNYGISGRPERTLLGRPVITCGSYLPSFTAATEGQIFAFIFNFSDYVLNTVYDMGIQRKQDWDTEDMLTKAVMSVDGKVVDKNSLVTIAKA